LFFPLKTGVIGRRVGMQPKTLNCSLHKPSMQKSLFEIISNKRVHGVNFIELPWILIYLCAATVCENEINDVVSLFYGSTSPRQMAALSTDYMIAKIMGCSYRSISPVSAGNWDVIVAIGKNIVWFQWSDFHRFILYVLQFQ
jgi:hypothetical protein